MAVRCFSRRLLLAVTRIMRHSFSGGLGPGLFCCSRPGVSWFNLSSWLAVLVSLIPAQGYNLSRTLPLLPRLRLGPFDRRS